MKDIGHLVSVTFFLRHSVVLFIFIDCCMYIYNIHKYMHVQYNCAKCNINTLYYCEHKFFAGFHHKYVLYIALGLVQTYSQQFMYKTI